VYHYEDDRNVIAAAPPCDFHLLAIDFGVTDACAFVVLGWRKHDPTVYVLEVRKELQLDPTGAAAITKQLIAQWDPVKIVGDTGGLGKAFAHEFTRRHAIPIEAAEKTNKTGYIKLLRGALERAELRVVERTGRPLLDEWDRLARDPKNPEREAPGFDNHAADATLYGWRATSAFAEQRPPPPPTREEYDAAEEADIWETAEAQEQRPWWDR
jgi:hypothetical protein